MFQVRVELAVRDSKGNLRKVSMSDCFHVPEKSENLVSVSNLLEEELEIFF